MQQVTFGSLFSGIGGFDKGFCDAGLELKWQCENDRYCTEQLEWHWPSVQRFEDVCDVHSGAWLDMTVRTWYAPTGSDYTYREQRMAGQLKKLTIEQVEESIRMYERGLSLAPIARYFGVSRQAMWDLLRRRITMRSQKRYGADNHFHRGGETADDQAQNLVETAISQGVIIRKTHCEECGDHGTFRDGRSKIQAHHDDYNKPLEVRWLCQKCHHKWHSRFQAKKKVIQTELAQVDVICGGFP